MADIREFRQILLTQGVSILEAREVPSTIDPTSVVFRPVTEIPNFRILEQRYANDFADRNRLMDLYDGKEVRLVFWNEFKDRRVDETAILRRANGQTYYEIGNELHTEHPGTLVLPDINQWDKDPVLRFKVNTENANGREVPFELSYLANGWNWSADYALRWDDKKGLVDWTGWVTLNNGTDAQYENAKVSFVAGTPRRVSYGSPYSPQPMYKAMRAEAMMASAAPMQDFGSSSMGEYYEFAAPQAVTVDRQGSVRMRLFRYPEVKAENSFEIDTQRISRVRPVTGEEEIPARLYLKITNAKDKGFGMALPAGVARVYIKDRWIGEDNVAYTPVGDTARLEVGEVFDVQALRKLIQHKDISTNMHEREWELEVFNRKTDTIQVVVWENFYGHWKILKAGEKYTQVDGQRIRFDLTLKPGESKKFRYRVQFGL